MKNGENMKNQSSYIVLLTIVIVIPAIILGAITALFLESVTPAKADAGCESCPTKTPTLTAPPIMTETPYFTPTYTPPPTETPVPVPTDTPTPTTTPTCEPPCLTCTPQPTYTPYPTYTEEPTGTLMPTPTPTQDINLQSLYFPFVVVGPCGGLVYCR
jgi:hypothetical protein